MQGADQLALIAELGIGYAGFLAIFLAFTRQQGRFSPADSLRVRAILLASFSALFSAVLPLALALFSLESGTLWQLASALSVAGFFMTCVIMARHEIAMSVDERAELGVVNNVLSWSMAGLVHILLVASLIDFPGGIREAFYVSALLFMLGISTSNFITIAFHRLL